MREDFGERIVEMEVDFYGVNYHRHNFVEER